MWLFLAGHVTRRMRPGGLLYDAERNLSAIAKFLIVIIAVIIIEDTGQFATWFNQKSVCSISVAFSYATAPLVVCLSICVTSNLHLGPAFGKETN